MLTSKCLRASDQNLFVKWFKSVVGATASKKPTNFKSPGLNQRFFSKASVPLCGRSVHLTWASLAVAKMLDACCQATVIDVPRRQILLSGILSSVTEISIGISPELPATGSSIGVCRLILESFEWVAAWYRHKCVTAIPCYSYRGLDIRQDPFSATVWSPAPSASGSEVISLRRMSPVSQRNIIICPMSLCVFSQRRRSVY